MPIRYASSGQVPAAASSNTWQQHRADLSFARQMMPASWYSYRQSRHLPKNCCICSRAAAAISAMPAGWWLLLLGGRPSTPPPAFGLRKPPELLRRLLPPLALLLPTPTSPRALRTPAMAAGRAERRQLGWDCAGHSWLPQLQCARSVCVCVTAIGMRGLAKSGARSTQVSVCSDKGKRA